jgi:hypothetical protein
LEELPSVGEEINFSIAWPMKLNDTIDLALRGVGRILRVQSDSVAIRFLRYEFRTKHLKKAAQSVSAARRVLSAAS